MLNRRKRFGVICLNLLCRILCHFLPDVMTRFCNQDYISVIKQYNMASLGLILLFKTLRTFKEGVRERVWGWGFESWLQMKALIRCTFYVSKAQGGNGFGAAFWLLS